MKFTILIFFLNFYYSNEIQDHINTLKDYFNTYNTQELHSQEAIELFTSFFSTKPSEEIHEIEERLLSNQEITEDEKSILILKNFTRKYFLEQAKNQSLTLEFLTQILLDNSYSQFVESLIEEFYNEQLEQEDFDIEEVKLPDLNELDEMFEKHKEKFKEEPKPFQDIEL